MKKIILLSVCFSFLAAASFAQRGTAPVPKKANKLEDTIQYSLGVYMMQQFFAKTGFVINDPAMFTKAINDVLAKRTLMVDPSTTQNRLLAYQASFIQEKGRQLEKLLIEKVKTDKGFTPLSTGVYYAVQKKGTGVIPSAKDTVILNVICTLPDGTVVDDTNKSKQSYMAIAGEMIPGLQDVLFRMQEGTIVRAIIPAARAYGEAGTNNIPSNSAVIYDVALVSVKPAR